MKTIEVPDELFTWLESYARSSGRPETEVIERALREYSRQEAIRAIQELQEAYAGIAADEEEADRIAVEEVRAYRQERSRGG